VSTSPLLSSVLFHFLFPLGTLCHAVPRCALLHWRCLQEDSESTRRYGLDGRPAGRCRHSMVCHNGALYIYGGDLGWADEDGEDRTVWRLDLQVGHSFWHALRLSVPLCGLLTWVDMGPLLAACCRLAGLLVYVFACRVPAILFVAHVQAEPLRWQRLYCRGQHPDKLKDHSAVVWGDLMVVYGGETRVSKYLVTSSFQHGAWAASRGLMQRWLLLLLGRQVGWLPVGCDLTRPATGCKCLHWLLGLMPTFDWPVGFHSRCRWPSLQSGDRGDCWAFDLVHRSWRQLMPQPPLRR